MQALTIQRFNKNVRLSILEVGDCREKAQVRGTVSQSLPLLSYAAAFSARPSYAETNINFDHVLTNSGN